MKSDRMEQGVISRVVPSSKMEQMIGRMTTNNIMELWKWRLGFKNLPLNLPISIKKFKSMVLMDVFWKNYEIIFYDSFNYFIKEFNIWATFLLVVWPILICCCKIC